MTITNSRHRRAPRKRPEEGDEKPDKVIAAKTPADVARSAGPVTLPQLRFMRQLPRNWP